MSNFTHKHYEETLIKFLDSDYKITNMDSVVEGKQLILSHDVDIDVSLVKSIAKIESDLKVPSTYFFRMGAKNYNLFSKYTLKILQDIKEMGHDIGFHYELPGSSEEFEENHIQQTFDFFEKYTGMRFKYFNIHEPSRSGLDISKFLSDKNRSYNSTFFESFKYLSDSSARWREGCFCEHVGNYEKLLVLTHPFWWFEKSPTQNY